MMIFLECIKINCSDIPDLANEQLIQALNKI
ncbi:hypothetical protein M945_4039 [Clostridium saccharobutylicum DSM 13864]|nr:hypothetical protein M945_4039 [Clostridium saccharobutylicum DSM 13864]